VDEERQVTSCTICEESLLSFRGLVDERAVERSPCAEQESIRINSTYSVNKVATSTAVHELESRNLHVPTKDVVNDVDNITYGCKVTLCLSRFCSWCLKRFRVCRWYEYLVL
jgi:hypothetical protein